MIHVDVHGLKIPKSELNVFEKYSKIERKDSVSYVLVYQNGKVIRVNKLIYKLSFPVPITTFGLGVYLAGRSYQERQLIDLTQEWVTTVAGICLIADASTGSYSIIRDILQGNQEEVEAS